MRTKRTESFWDHTLLRGGGEDPSFEGKRHFIRKTTLFFLLGKTFGGSGKLPPPPPPIDITLLLWHFTGMLFHEVNAAFGEQLFMGPAAMCLKLNLIGRSSS